jgi:hypothetical protein
MQETPAAYRFATLGGVSQTKCRSVANCGATPTPSPLGEGGSGVAKLREVPSIALSSATASSGAGVAVLATTGNFTLFDRGRSKSSPDWVNLKLVLTGRAPKNNWWFGWNGERLLPGARLDTLDYGFHFPIPRPRKNPPCQSSLDDCSTTASSHHWLDPLARATGVP